MASKFSTSFRPSRAAASILSIVSLFLSQAAVSSDAGSFTARRADAAPTIDGDPTDSAWQDTAWRKLKYLSVGTEPSAEDFSGRYKLVWTPDFLYVLAQINDDVLIDTHADPLIAYWEDDLLEILIDEDASGGIHLEDFNAFAYHIALDNQVVDIAPKGNEVKPRLFPNHVNARWQRDTHAGDAIYWEARIAVHDDTHVYGDDRSSRVTLNAGKTLGWMVAYCDADDASGRKRFMGDVEVAPVNGDRNRAYIDASVFGTVTLVEQ